MIIKILQIIILSLLVSISIQIYAHEHFLISGATVFLDFDSVFARYTSPLSHDDLRKLAIDITDLYKQHGYTTSYVDKIIVHKNSTIEIIVRESKIKSIFVTGISEKKALQLKKIIVPTNNEIYNSIIIKERSEFAVKTLNLSNIKIKVYNAPDSPDVILNIKAQDSLIGRTTLQIKWEPIYEFSPSIIAHHGFFDFEIEIHGGVGIRDAILCKKFATSSLFYSLDKNIKFFATYGIYVTNEIWQETNKEYSVISHRGDTGIKYNFNNKNELRFFASSSRFNLENYNLSSSMHYDAFINLLWQYRTTPLYIISLDATELLFLVSFGKNELENRLVVSSNVEGYTCIHLSPFFALRPSVKGTYTSSNERYYFSYLYDEYFPIKQKDFTAICGKIIGSMYFDFEIYPEILKCGPVMFFSAFQKTHTADLLSEWGGGINVRFVFNRFFINASFVFPIDKTCENPVLLFSTTGTF